ncbi:MAG: hypothetical protein ACREV5_11985, partial [Steroidobacter sp.]
MGDAIHEASDDAASQDSEHQREGMSALERLRGRADLTPSQRATIEMNFAAGLQFSGRHHEALEILNRVRNGGSRDPALDVWIALKTGVSQAAIGDVERASHCFDQALAAAPQTNDLLLRA